MAGIGRPEPKKAPAAPAAAGGASDKAPEKKTSAQKTVEELKQDFATAVAKIRAILNGRTDKNSLSEEDKQKLCIEYTNAANIARILGQRCIDEQEAADFTAKGKQLAAKAKSYGSVMGEIPKTTFADVKGLEHVKRMVESFTYMSEHPDILAHYHMSGGMGMMMYGAPGTGKTMFAEAVANKLNLPLFVVTPADIFKSYVGASEQAVRQLFDALDACPDGAVLFVDECESIFSRRTDDTKDYKAAVTTELLQRLNGFGVDGSRRILIAATNRPDQIDPAYLRYKRFSHLVHVTPPDREAKRAIIESKLRGIELSGITIDEIVERTEQPYRQQTPMGIVEHKGYYSAADICGLIEETCRQAVEELERTNGTTPIPLTRAMFDSSFERMPPSISQETLNTYLTFNKTQ